MVAETKTRAVTLLFSPGGTVEMVVRNQETGDEGREYLVCESYEGEAVTICFNVDFLIDFLTVATTEQVTLGMRTPAPKRCSSRFAPRRRGFTSTWSCP